MILIVDNGATKSEWHFIDNHKLVKSVTLLGYNPSTGNNENKSQFFHQIKSSIPSFKGKIYFYSTGVSNKKNRNCLLLELQHQFPNADVYIHTDLTAAGRSLYHNNEGIVAILGTGSNAGYYNGNTIIHQPLSLGYLLGDEGSGAYIGKLLLKDYLEDTMPKSLEKILHQFFQTDKKETIQTIYRNYTGTHYGKIVYELKDHVETTYFNQLILQSFNNFFNHIVSRVHYASEKKIAFVGSIAFHFQKQLQSISTKHGFEIISIKENTKKELIEYHAQIDV